MFKFYLKLDTLKYALKWILLFIHYYSILKWKIKWEMGRRDESKYKILHAFSKMVVLESKADKFGKKGKKQL